MAGILEAFLAGKEARRVADAQEQINAMQQFVGQNGQAIMAGDQNALGQLAGFGPEGLGMAMNVQNNLDVRQDRAYNRDRAKVEDGRADEKWRLEVEEYKKGLTAEQAAAEAATYENAAKMALTATSPEQWDQLATENGAPELVGQFDNRQAVAARFMTTAEVLKSTQPPSEADALDLEKKRLEVEALRNPAPPKPADEYERYAQEETKAGRQPLSRIDFAQALKGKGITQTIRNADGSETTIQIGGPATGGAGDEIKVGDVYNPAAATDAVNLINDILGADDKGDITPEGKATIERITGTLEGGGGNDINAMSGARRAWYGDKGVDKIEKLGQLESKAWLAARDMLKGGGPITDYESRKAEAAVARLSRAKGPEEFIAALTELRDAITAGEAKLRAARGTAAPATATPDPAATPGGVPEGVDPADWEYMTPEERALFQ